MNARAGDRTLGRAVDNLKQDAQLPAIALFFLGFVIPSRAGSSPLVPPESALERHTDGTWEGPSPMGGYGYSRRGSEAGRGEHRGEGDVPRQLTALGDERSSKQDYDDEVIARYRDLPFEGPFDFFARSWRAAVRREPIVYRLRVWDAETSTFRSVARAGGVDADGILDIGESEDGWRRLDDFCCAAKGKPRSHRAGWEYSGNGYDFGSVFAPESLRIEFIHLPSKELAEALELALLEDYRWRFKDRPPLNGSAGKYSKVYEWLAQQGRTPRDADGWIDLSGLLPVSTAPSSSRAR